MTTSFTEDLLTASSNMKHSLSTTILNAYIQTHTFKNIIKYIIVAKYNKQIYV